MSETPNLTIASQMPFKLRKLSAFFAMEVTDIDLAKQLDDETVAALVQALADHELLVFPRQQISSDDLKRVGRYFGDLTVNPFATNAADAPEIIVMDNKEGNPPGGTDMWHTDETFRALPPLATLLCCKITPEVGGDTVFHSMTAAYEALSPRMRDFIEGLEAVHDITRFKKAYSYTDKDRAVLDRLDATYPPVTHPVVCKHPVTGKRLLFVNPQFTRFIKGMEDRDSIELLDQLYQVTRVLEHQFRLRWEPDMLVIWDNRSTQHSAVHDYYPQRRKMERVTVKGVPPVPASEPAAAKELRHFKIPPLADFKATRSVREFERAR